MIVKFYNKTEHSATSSVVNAPFFVLPAAVTCATAPSENAVPPRFAAKHSLVAGTEHALPDNGGCRRALLNGFRLLLREEFTAFPDLSSTVGGSLCRGAGSYWFPVVALQQL